MKTIGEQQVSGFVFINDDFDFMIAAYNVL